MRGRSPARPNLSTERTLQWPDNRVNVGYSMTDQARPVYFQVPLCLLNTSHLSISLLA